jgi:hypothetical protein
MRRHANRKTCESDLMPTFDSRQRLALGHVVRVSLLFDPIAPVPRLLAAAARTKPCPEHRLGDRPVFQLKMRAGVPFPETASMDKAWRSKGPSRHQFSDPA